MSPLWVQYETLDGTAHVPFVQTLLQQSPLPFGHALPAVLHMVFTGAQVPLHTVLQQVVRRAAVAVGGYRRSMPDVPLSQRRLQQSVATLQLAPAARHEPPSVFTP